MNAAQLKSRAGAALLALAVMWSITASWLSASQFIGVRAEVLSYKYCFLTALCGAFYFIKVTKMAGRKRVVRAVSVCALLAIVVAWWFSDQLFTYWKMKTVPVEAWQQAASDIEKLAREAPTGDKEQPWASKASQLPRSVDVIGLPKDYASGIGGKGLYGGSDVIACVTYGFKPRTWGLLVGPENIVRTGWRKYRIIPVSTNAFFFVGANY